MNSAPERTGKEKPNMSRNQPRTPQDRSRFLHPPPDLRAPLEDPETLRLLEQAEDRLQQFLPWKEENFHPRNQLIWTEAQASSHIEEEYGQGRIARHRQALAAYLQKPLGAQTLLQMHRTMMAGQLHAQPGQYRTIGILIGQYQPPRHPYVPGLMDGLYHYIQNSQDRPIVKAAWAHIQFETIHPFADGNGRTGRAIINRILDSPLPLSVHILNHRQTYFRLLGNGSWDDYLAWFVRGVGEQCLA